jgi:hypothetical protein
MELLGLDETAVSSISVSGVLPAATPELPEEAVAEPQNAGRICGGADVHAK